MGQTRIARNWRAVRVTANASGVPILARRQSRGTMRFMRAIESETARGSMPREYGSRPVSPIFTARTTGSGRNIPSPSEPFLCPTTITTSLPVRTRMARLLPALMGRVEAGRTTVHPVVRCSVTQTSEAAVNDRTRGTLLTCQQAAANRTSSRQGALDCSTASPLTNSSTGRSRPTLCENLVRPTRIQPRTRDPLPPWC
jgi:hypothetical protein